MSLKNARIFGEIAIQRSLTKAATALGISQPAVSQALQHLEDRLGVTLVDRSHRPLVLTAAGQVYFDQGQKWVNDYQAIEDAVHSASGIVAGRVRVASIYSVGLLEMASYVNQFREEYPDVDLTLNYAQTDEVYGRVRRDEVDLGIVSFPRDGGDIGCVPWQEQQMVVAVSPDHLFAENASIGIDELAGASFVTFSKPLTIGRMIEKLLKKHDVAVEVVHRFDNVENVKRAAEIGLGAAILPLATMQRELEYGSLKAIPFSDIEFVRPLGIVHRRNKHLMQAVEKFVELLHGGSARDVSDGSAIPGHFEEMESIPTRN